MPFNGSGIYEPIAAPDFPAVALTTIRAAQYNAEILDIAQALGQCLTRTGEGPALANIPMGGYQFTGLGAPSAAGQALVFGQNGTIANLTATGTIEASGKVTASAGLDVTGNALVTGTLAMGSAFEGRNKLINGDFRVVQRGIAMASGLAVETYTLDRWGVYTTGSSLGINRSVGPNASIPYAIAATGESGNTGLQFFQRVESLNSASLSGKAVTVSGWVYSNEAVTATYTIYSANTVDVFTAKTSRHNGNLPLTSAGWQQFSFTIASFNATAAANGFQLNINLQATGAGIVKALANIQLEEGSIATPFVSRPYGQELALCQRYYRVLQALVSTGWVAANPGPNLIENFPMRAAPTIGTVTYNSGTGATFMAVNNACVTQSAAHSENQRVATVPLSAEL